MGTQSNLVGAADEIEVVLMQELLDNVGPEDERDSSVILAPAFGVLLGVSPQQVAQQPCDPGTGSCQPSGEISKHKIGKQRRIHFTDDWNMAGTVTPAIYTRSPFSPPPPHTHTHTPVSGTSVGRSIFRIWSNVCRSGESPPWQQKILLATMAATGRQLKQSVNVFHSFTLYRRLPVRHQGTGEP